MHNFKLKKKYTSKFIFWIIIFIFFFGSIILFKFVRSMDNLISPIEEINFIKVFENIELKKQSDFKLIGKKIFKGGGNEPGFSFVISLAGNKFGTDLTTQYGDARYVGYLDLINQSTSTKIFGGNMLDKNNNVVRGEFKILNKKCTQDSGSTTPYTVNIKVATSTLLGCAEMLN